ncbi:MAG: DNA internalization-related competence protein ComEC/Rec2 [Desulforhopalus sp.]
MKDPLSYIDENLLVCTTVSFICGIFLALHIRVPTSSVHLFGLSLALLLLSLIVLQFYSKSRLLLLLLPIFFIGMGCFQTLLHLQVPGSRQHIFHHIQKKKELIAVGTQTSMANFNGRTSQVTFKVSSLQFKQKERLTPASGTILLRLQGPWPVAYQPGDRLVIRGDFKRPTSYRTPGSLDYAQYLARRDIWVTGFIRSTKFMQELPANHSFFQQVKYLPERIRTRLGNHIDRALGPDSNGVYRAILIGDRSRVDDTVLETFKGSGTMHILAISGLHVAVIGSLVYGLIYYILSRSEKLLLFCTVKKWAAFLSLPILAGYALLAGHNTPVARAVVMSTVVIFSICTDRQKSPGPLVAFAALLLLAIDPQQLFSTSFQLSFSAVVAILFLLPTLKRLLGNFHTTSSKEHVKRKLINWLLAALLVSVAATAATAPIAIKTFNRFSPIGLIANLIVEPLICLWSLPIGFLAIPFSLVLPEISALLFQIGNLGLVLAVQTTTFFSSFSYSTLWLPNPPSILLLTYYFILIVFAVWGYNSKRRAVLCVSILFLCVLFFLKPSAMKPFQQRSPDFIVTYLDVGQGSASLVEFPSGMRILIDGGGGSFGGADVGQRVIAPFLWHKGINHLDAVVITHPDADHYNGLGFIVEHFTPRSLWIRDKLGHDDKFRNLLQLAYKNKTSVIIPAKDQKMGPSEAEHISCIANTLTITHKKTTTRPAIRSNSGLILKACSGKFCTLFPGDIEKEEERLLVAGDQDDLKANILLAPHHGSATSNSPAFLTAVSPEFLIVSARRSSAGHFPDSKVQNECKRQGITLYSTSEQGTIELIVNRNRYRLNGYVRTTENPHYPMQAVVLAGTQKKARRVADQVRMLSPGIDN